MPKYHCCVPKCHVSHRNKPPEVQFYRIPSDPGQRKIYKVILKNDSLKLDSQNTRICSLHWEGGKKLSRTHLPTLFPWTTPRNERRKLVRREYFNARRLISVENVGVIDEGQEGSATKFVDDKHICSFIYKGHCRKSDKVSLDDERQAICEKLSKFERETKELKDELKQKIQVIDEMKEKLMDADHTIKRLEYQISNTRFDIDKYQQNDKDIEFYTGLPDYSTLLLCFNLVEDSAQRMSYINHDKKQSVNKLGRLRILTLFQEFVMVLMRIRLGLFEKDLAHRFLISDSSVSLIVRTWLRLLRSEFEPLINLPPRDVITLHSPKQFKELFPKVAIIVDCTEIEMEKPSALDLQSACYSSYKSKPTMKCLIGITPSGVTAFVSELFPGSTSDKEITVMSGFLDILQHGDEVMADKGFNVKDELASVGVSLAMPEYLKKDTQFTIDQSIKNKTIASLKVHVERFMERIKNWHIIDKRIPISMAPYASDIVIVICALSNFLPPLIK
ncbi:uncharacterized protein LOC116296808 [Actinia tenebrosa]|uniref:Uncharacterized protein LOC116296808 n=1 Tax=Actinia tenebrosa TaxID=6105 RepID=A0A6P8HZC6_ACTTE|nr:uncharacterized protein LOC116296808 [Actinia tenebrosa]